MNEERMHDWTEQAQQEAEAKVFRMAANDPEFRALALRDGNAAVEKATGRSLTDGLMIRFVDPAGEHLTAVLQRATFDDEELAEHELMAVAGGKGGHRRRGGGRTNRPGPESPSSEVDVFTPTSDE